MRALRSLVFIYLNFVSGKELKIHGAGQRKDMLIFDSVINPDRHLSLLLCLQLFAMVSLVSSASLADLTCETLLMLAGNVSRKSKTSINSAVITTLPSFFYKQLFPRAVKSKCLSRLPVSTLVRFN